MPQLGKVNTNVGLKKIIEGAYLIWPKLVAPSAP
jgi:hypothetical protein